MEETNTPMFKSARPMESQMDEILSETKDPVSGNTAPVGAMPEEVRDDIPIMASPNEFMIDAATRRYYGTEFFEGLQDAAKQGFQRIKKGEESFFRDDELEVEEAAEKVTSGGSPQQMQQGGEIQKLSNGGEVDEVPGSGTEIPPPIGGGYGGYGGASRFVGYTFEYYVHPTKPEIQIIFFNGRPLSPIPEGYVRKGQEVVEAIEEVTQSDDDGGVDISQEIITWANTDVDDWSEKGRGTKLWKAYGSKTGVGVSAIEKFFAGSAAVALTGGASIFTGPTLVNKMESEAAKKAQAILKKAKGILAAGGLSAEDEVIYKAAEAKAQAEVDYFKEKKPFSWKEILGIGEEEEEETIITPQVITVGDDDEPPEGTDPGFISDTTGKIIKPKVRPPQQTSIDYDAIADSYGE